MPNETTTPIPSLGAYRKRQQAAKDRAEARKATPDVRAARAALLDARDAAMAAENEAEARKTSRPAEVLNELLLIGPTEVLEELQRGMATLSTRQIADAIGNVLTARRRKRHTADIAASTVRARKPAKAA